jgi:cyclopropane fatty-acyl-phospholipid synthase-like methyltransferase
MTQNNEEKYRITAEAFNRQAQVYQDYFMDVDLYNDTYDLFCDAIKKENPKILEAGCGPGNITRYLLSKRRDFRILGTDVAPNMVRLAEINNPGAQFKVMDARNIGELSEKYDGIVCGFCMPYLSKEDCAELIKDCHSLLNDGGVLYFSVIEDNYDKSEYETSSQGEKFFQYYHEEGYLKKYLNENKFTLLALERKQLIRPNRSVSKNLIFIAKK